MQISEEQLNQHMWDKARIYHKYGVHKSVLEGWQAEFRIWLRSELEKLKEQINGKMAPRDHQVK
jgi:hypothetical protein